MRVYVFILFVLINLAFCKAQGDSLHYEELFLLEIEISGKDDFNTGAATLKFDSSILAQKGNITLAELLSTEGGVFIKSYGLGNLASSSVRGAGAQHTKVLWNGLDVSNPMLGQVDFSYFNVNSFDDISIQFGNTNGLHGSGTQGGVINLNNKLEFDNADKLKLNLKSGSFGLLSKSINYQTSSASISTQLHLNQSNAINNYSYLDNGTEKKIQNADVNSYGFNLNNLIKITSYQHLKANFWFQKNERGIPTGIGISNKNERLNNQFLRSFLEWNKYGYKHDYKVLAAFFEENLDYINPISRIYNYTKFRKWIAETEVIKRINKNNELILGVNLTSIKAFTDNYSFVPNRITNAYFISYNKFMFDAKLKITPALRKEFGNNFKVPLTSSLGVDYMVTKKLKLMGSISDNYRLPTFNDLYFGNLGNSNLKPEDGWSSEISTKYTSKLFNIRFTGFYNDYNNWISWKPQRTGIWQPQNNNVFTRGFELNNNIELKAIFFRLTASYTESIDALTNKQLIYVPLISANYTIGYSFGKNRISYNQQYVSERFISTDNKNKLPLYLVGNIKGMRKIRIDESIINFGFEINNLFNTTFQAVVNQPMPGRYYGFNISIEFNNKKKKDD